MKGRAKIILIIIIAVIVLFPIRLQFKDGGTVIYRAILYAVTDYHSIRGPGGFDTGIEIRVLGIPVYSNTTHGKEIILVGRYITEDGTAYVDIQEGNRFYLNRHISTSYDPVGNYIINDNKLILQVNGDETQPIVFEISGNKLIFESGKLAEPIIPKGKIFIYE